jgi:stage II sporulation protein E
LIAAFLWGSGGGTMVGVMAGIIPSLTSSVFAQTLGMYAISGLLAGIFKNFGRLGVIIGYMLGTLALSMFVSETHLAVLGIWETGIASVIFLLLPESLKEKVPLESLGPLTRNKESMINNLDISIKETAQNRIHHLAQVFEELSSTFSQPGTPPTEKVNYLNYLYDELSHGFCEGCSRHNNCWNRDCYSTSQEILDILTIAEKAGQVNYEECPPAFKRKCLHGRELINAINYLFDNLRMNEYWSEKLGESRELVAVQLKGVSQVVKNLAEEIDIKTEVDYELRDKLLRSCKRIGVNLKEITPLYIAGQQLRLEVVAGSCVDGTGCDISIAPALSSIMGEKLEVTDKRCPRFMGKGACEFTLTRAFSYRS